MTPPDKLSHLTEQERGGWELAQKATPGPLIVSRSIPVGDEPSRVTIDALRSGGMGEVVADIKWHRNAEDLRFFAAARTGYPAALEQLSSARGEIARWKAIEKYLPPGFEIGDDATVELAVELAAAESRLRDLREKVGKIKELSQLKADQWRHMSEIEKIAAALLEGQHG